MRLALLLLAVIAPWACASDAIDRALADWGAEAARAKQAYEASKARTDEKAVRVLDGLAQAATRKGDIVEAAAAWRAVIRIDREHAKAREFFTATGQLEDVLAEVEVEVDLLGNPVPATAPKASTAKVVEIGAIPSGVCSLGPQKAGTRIALQYVGGTWSPFLGPLAGGGGAQSPDSSEAGDPFRLVLGMKGSEDEPVVVLATVPAGTEKKPFTYRLQRDVDDLVLWITPGRRPARNEGRVEYRVGIAAP